MTNCEGMTKEPIVDTIRGLNALKEAQIVFTLEEWGFERSAYEELPCTTIEEAIAFKQYPVSKKCRYLAQMQRQIHFDVMISLGLSVPDDYQEEDLELAFEMLDMLMQEDRYHNQNCQR